MTHFEVLLDTEQFHWTNGEYSHHSRVMENYRPGIALSAIVNSLTKLIVIEF